MNRMLSIAVCIAIVTGACVARGEAVFQNLSGADFRPGALKLPLTVHERGGVERKGAVVTSGVPFPPGFLADVARLGVVDKDGKPVVSQASAMIKWHKPAYDDSVQWALVSFVADVPAGGTAAYYLTDDGKAAPPASALKLVRTERELSIDTGAASFVIPLQGDAIISKATIGGAEVIGGAGLRGIITAGEWPERNLKPGDKLAATHDPAGVTVEESGPARLVVGLRGSYSPGDKDGKFYAWQARLHFDVTSPSVRVVYTISNSRLDPKLHASGQSKNRLAYIWPIEDASLLADLSLGSGAGVTTRAEGNTLAQAVAGDLLTVYQDSSGGELWDTVPGAAGDKAKVRGVTFRGYKVTLGGKDIAAGNAHAGVLDAADSARGLTVARRFFREEWPGAVGMSARQLRVGLFPAEFSEPFHLNLGQRKSWDIRLTLHGAGAPDLQQAFAVQDALLLFRPDPACMVRAGGLSGAWSAGLAMTKGPAKAGQRRDAGKIDSPALKGGWDGFGVISSWNAGGSHWNEQTAFADWVLHGSGVEFDNSEIPTLWAADHCPIQYDSPDMSSLFPYISHGNTDHVRMKIGTYPGYYSRVSWGRPDSGHMGMWMWVEYYLLTGDSRAREAVCNLGNMARAHLWRYTHDDPKDGNGPTSYPFPDYRKRNPDTDPDFKLDTRYVGWPLYCLAQYYQFTGEPQLLEEARIIARSFRNTARACPIGQLVRDAAGKDGTEPTEYSGNITRGRDGVASQVRESKRSASLAASNFYSGIMTYGLREYYLVSRDIEILDTLVGQIDRFCNYTLIRNPERKPAGWTYIFGDYWGPYTWEDTVHPGSGKPGAGFTSSNGLVCDALARIYALASRADLMEVLRAAEAANRNNSSTLALTMAVTHPKADQTPPGAVGDLAAEPLGGGKVKLTWSAPGGDGTAGQAAWYQVKWSAAQIVERVQGWPDRTEPLPGTRKEWLEKAAAFNARQRSFWAANNLANAPKPGPAGARETMIVDGMAPGETSFAVKTWDDTGNISDLSNVVRVTVK